MSPDAIRNFVISTRTYLKLDKTGLAKALRMGPTGRRRVDGWETGEYNPSGTTIVALELLVLMGPERVAEYVRNRS